MKGWVKRDDLFLEVSLWLRREAATSRNKWLICESGMSKTGDKILRESPHIVHANRPFLYVDVSSVDVQLLAKTLRWGRSHRFLGAVAAPHGAELPMLPIISGEFICDALQADTVIVTRLR